MSALQGIFTAILNMSITVSYVAVGVIFLRSLLFKAPKVFSYVLWSAVLFRSVCPFSFSSPLSLLGLLDLNVNPGNGIGFVEYVPRDIGLAQSPAIRSGISGADKVVGGSLPHGIPAASVNPMQVWMTGLSLAWLAGFVLLVAYAAISYFRMKARLQTATRAEGPVGSNVYESDQIGTAFVCGILHPRIYIPVGVRETDLVHILAHEQTHLKRRDYLVKALASLALAVHWFNPLMWLSFRLMSRDMEMSCDEGVLRRLGGREDGARTSYSGSLLSLSLKEKGTLTAGPLAFGESDVKRRIENVLRYKKPGVWIGLVAGIVVLAATLAMAANPRQKSSTTPTGQAFQQDDAIASIRAKAMQFSTEETDLVKIGQAAVGHYYSAFMGESIPKECRITGFRVKDVALLAGDEKEFCVQVTSDYSTTGLYFLSANGRFTPTGAGYDCQDDYSEFRIKSLGGRDYQIVGIGTGGGAQGLRPVDPVDIEALVEDSIKSIMSSPQTSSNPQDYISAHPDAYERVLKHGGEDALSYMLSQFESGNAKGLRGQIMMRLCKELLGPRNNVEDNTLSPEDWYSRLSVREEVKLLDFVYQGDDPVEKLVYATEVAMNSQLERGFTVVAPRIFGVYQEGDMMKVFVTTYSATYRLYGSVLDLESGSVIPSAITYQKGESGDWRVAGYTPARDGTEFTPSIRAFCTMPVSGNEIPGLADKILDHYGDYNDIRVLQYKNLHQHLEGNGITSANLTTSRGEVRFDMKDPRYTP